MRNTIILFFSFLLLFFLIFYRIGCNVCCKTENDKDILAPSYGTVYKIIKDNTKVHIITRLTPIDNHRQFSPVKGTYLKSIYDRTGKFHIVFTPNKSDENEKKLHYFSTPYGPIEVIQIAGFLTRNIESWLKEGSVNAGDELGIIHFGSRVDIILPPNIKIHIKEGDRVYGSCSKIASFI